MFTVIAQQGNIELHLDTSNSARTIRVFDNDARLGFGITLQPEDLPGIALNLLRSVPTTPYSANIDGAACCLVQYLKEQEAKEAEAKLRQRQDALTLAMYSDLVYDQISLNAQKAIDRIIELEDKLEAQK